mmetsp:Transcript_19704/g.60956  ORF Transcript_19704/g.60956 Transcript_19704/m.60956 type:complete len:477 (-) Transcript_19704:2400-3830(-)
MRGHGRSAVRAVRAPGRRRARVHGPRRHGLACDRGVVGGGLRHVVWRRSSRRIVGSDARAAAPERGRRPRRRPFFHVCRVAPARPGVDVARRARRGPRLSIDTATPESRRAAVLRRLRRPPQERLAPRPPRTAHHRRRQRDRLVVVVSATAGAPERRRLFGARHAATGRVRLRGLLRRDRRGGRGSANGRRPALDGAARRHAQRRRRPRAPRRTRLPRRRHRPELSRPRSSAKSLAADVVRQELSGPRRLGRARGVRRGRRLQTPRPRRLGPLRAPRPRRRQGTRQEHRPGPPRPSGAVGQRRRRRQPTTRDDLRRRQRQERRCAYDRVVAAPDAAAGAPGQCVVDVAGAQRRRGAGALEEPVPRGPRPLELRRHEPPPGLGPGARQSRVAARPRRLARPLRRNRRRRRRRLLRAHPPEEPPLLPAQPVHRHPALLAVLARRPQARQAQGPLRPRLTLTAPSFFLACRDSCSLLLF